MLKLPWPYCGYPENNDCWVHRLVFPFKKRGFFVELGAADGVSGSSCYILERIGWHGICVETCSAFFPALCRNRKAVCDKVCITDRTGFVHFEEDRFLSRVVPFRYEFHRQQRIVTSMTLADLLQKHQAPKAIDYLAMDIEGMDGLVLRAFPFHEYRILAISMEADNANDILTQNEYAKMRNPFNTSCPWEMYYLHESITSGGS